jgi:uncharacterized protein involved in outer membrane biogenesis
VVVAAMVVTLLVCELAGWPFLAGPVQNALSQTLKRQVLLRDPQAEGSGARVRFFGNLRADVPLLQIAAPAWSEKPYFLRAENAHVRLSYRALWRARSGAALDIEELNAQRLVVHAERLLDGRSSWAFGDPAAPAPATPKEPTPIPTVHELRVQDGELTWVDAPLRANLRAKLQLAEGDTGAQAPRPLPQALQGLLASAEGTYGAVTVRADLRSAGATPLLKTGDDAAATPVALELRAGKAELSFRGTVTYVLKLAGMTGSFRVSGPSLAAAGDPLGVTLPTTGPFVLAGRIRKEGLVWNFVAEDATVGSSKLRAALTYDTRPKVPLLSGRVSGPRMLLADLAPAVGGEPGAPPALPKGADKKNTPRSQRVLPDREFDLPSLRAMNANVIMDFDRVELGDLFAQPLQPLKAHLTLDGGKLRIEDLVAKTADGDVAGNITLDGTGKQALWSADLRWRNVALENWLKQDRGGNAPPYVAGRLNGRASLKGQGRSTAQILGSLNGTATTWLRDGKLSHLAIEAAGIDVAQALGVLVKGDQQLTVNCGLADLQAEKGVLQSRAFVIDTKDSAVWVTGTVSMVDEKLDLRAVTSPKDFSPLALRTPVHLRGTMGEPAISLEKAPLGRKLGAATLLALINPLAALIPFIDPGNDGPENAGCPELLERARKSAGVQTAVR